MGLERRPEVLFGAGKTNDRRVLSGFDRCAIGGEHHPADLLDIVIRHVDVKEIAHRVDEDFARLSPAERIAEFFRDESKIEALFERVIGNAAESLGESFGVTMSATGTDFRAATDGIPRGVSPFDF